MKLALTSLAFILSIAHTFACSCLETKAPLQEKIQDAFSNADIILKGTVINIETTNQDLTVSSFAPVMYTFKIVKSLKGKLKTETLTLLSASSSASCGYRFALGTSYLVYAKSASTFANITGHTTDYVTSLCDRNSPLNNVSKEELKLLKKLKCKLKRT